MTTTMLHAVHSWLKNVQWSFHATKKNVPPLSVCTFCESLPIRISAKWLHVNSTMCSWTLCWQENVLNFFLVFYLTEMLGKWKNSPKNSLGFIQELLCSSECFGNYVCVRVWENWSDVAVTEYWETEIKNRQSGLKCLKRWMLCFNQVVI